MKNIFFYTTTEEIIRKLNLNHDLHKKRRNRIRNALEIKLKY